MAFSLCNRKNTSSTSAGAPIIEEVTYMKDSVAYKESQTKKSKKKTSSRKKKDTSKKTKSFRQRSPLDEPV